MVRPAGLFVLEEVNAVVLLPADQALVETLGYQCVGSRNSARWSFGTLKAVCLENELNRVTIGQLITDSHSHLDEPSVCCIGPGTCA